MANDVAKLEDALRSVLQRAADLTVEAPETWEDRIASKPPTEWDDDEWTFANQRGLIPPEFQVTYETKLANERHARELALIRGEPVEAPNFGGNMPGAGTATLSPPLPASVVSPADRLRRIEEMKAALEAEESAARAAMADEEASASSDAEEAPPYEDWDYPDLKNEAKARGLDQSGKKEDLTARLYAHDEAASNPTP
jgi:hypothetical protein